MTPTHKRAPAPPYICYISHTHGDDDSIVVVSGWWRGANTSPVAPCDARRHECTAAIANLQSAKVQIFQQYRCTGWVVIGVSNRRPLACHFPAQQPAHRCVGLVVARPMRQPPATRYAPPRTQQHRTKNVQIQPLTALYTAMYRCASTAIKPRFYWTSRSRVISWLIRTISARISLLILGRPPRQWPHEPDRQIAHKPRRRQRKTVAGWTVIRLRCQFAHQRDSNTQNSRSLGRKHGRRVPVRCM